MKPLRCLYCGDSLSPIMGWRGSAYMQERTFDGMECDNYQCGAEWDAEGRGTAMSRLETTPPTTTSTGKAS